MNKIVSLTLIGMFLTFGVSFAGNTEGDFRKTVTSAGTAEALSSTNVPFKQVTICAEEDNSAAVVLGGSTVVAALATRRGIPLASSPYNHCVNLSCENSNDCGNLNAIYLDAVYSGDGVTGHYTQQKVSY